MRRRSPTCVRCGYNLAGLAARGQWTVCPECGHECDATSTIYPLAWPRPARLIVMIVWPCAVALGVAGGVGLVARLAVSDPTLIDTFGLGLGGLCALLLWPSVPGVVALHISLRHTMPFDRTLVTLMLWFVGVLVYAILLGVGALVLKMQQ